MTRAPTPWPQLFTGKENAENKPKNRKKKKKECFEKD